MKRRYEMGDSWMWVIGPGGHIDGEMAIDNYGPVWLIRGRSKVVVRLSIGLTEGSRKQFYTTVRDVCK